MRRLGGLLALAACAPAPEILDAAVRDARPLPAADCPPPGPFGTEQGALLTNLAWRDCAGTPVELHDLCGARAGLVVNFYGWCPSCYDFLELSGALYAEHAVDGLSVISVVSEDPLYRPATAEYCAQIAERYGRGQTVVYDPDKKIELYGTTDLALVTDRDGRIIFLRRDATEDAVRAAVEAELARP